MKKPIVHRIFLPVFMWVCSCQGSAPTEVSQEKRKPSNFNESSMNSKKEGKKSRTEIDEIPANPRALLKGHDVFSCVQKPHQSAGSSPELCFEVSRIPIGNDDTAIQQAQALCGQNQWKMGDPCPRSGVLAVCKGAVMSSGLSYDKYLYKRGLSIDDECQANGGQQVAELR